MFSQVFYFVFRVTRVYFTYYVITVQTDGVTPSRVTGSNQATVGHGLLCRIYFMVWYSRTSSFALSPPPRGCARCVCFFLPPLLLLQVTSEHGNSLKLTCYEEQAGGKTLIGEGSTKVAETGPEGTWIPITDDRRVSVVATEGRSAVTTERQVWSRSKGR